ncbi:unnamed protein product [Calicophoron daubneyi]|uniref:DUF4806 domain-containing protein n=1 Tax=Calicophoron daubneyi TaxID=300641 RepID=A0AAV2SXG5_CALDB
MPSVPPKTLYHAAENHTPCQPEDKRYAFKEIFHTSMFWFARKKEREMSEDSSFSSEGTLIMGLPPKRKIKRKVFSEEETQRSPKEYVPRPAPAEYQVPQLESCSSNTGEDQLAFIPRFPSPTITRIPTTPMRTVSHPRHILPVNYRSSPVTAITGLHTTPPMSSSCTTNHLTPSERLQSPPAHQTPVFNSPVQSTSRRSNSISTEDLHGLLVEISKQVKRNQAMIAHIYEYCKDKEQLEGKTCAAKNTAGDSPATDTAVPAYTMKQVIALDRKLADRVFYKQLSDQFMGIPGLTLRNLVRNILSRIFSPAMCEEIHCTGKNRPYVFKNSNIYGFLLDQVSRRPDFSSVPSSTVAYEARLWFRLRRERKKESTSVVVRLSTEAEDETSEEQDDSEAAL